jgi:photosystem II stability/assembly factor-like uncharacterized protein
MEVTPMDDLTPVLAGGWAAFVQPDGPNTEPIYLACHDFDDPEQDLGDLTLIFCPDPDQPNKWKVSGSYQGEPSPVTFTITTSVRKTKDTLQTVVCPAPLYLMEMCGKRNIFTNWDSQAVLFDPSIITSKGLQNVGKKNPGDQNESMRSFGVAAETFDNPFRPKSGRQSIAETGALNGIAVCGTPKCADACGEASALGANLVTVPAAKAGSPTDTAFPWYTTDKGQIWTVATAAPFAAGEDIGPVVCVDIGGGITREIVARGETDAGNPAEIAYSDDNGATWTTVNVGSVDGQYALTGRSLFALDAEHIWLVTSGGYVYFSGDAGETWTAQHSGTLTAQNLYFIHGSDERNLLAGGAADAMLKSADGGLTWSLVTVTGSGDVITRGFVINKNKFWVGTDGGDLWYATDGGTTWTQRAFSGDGAGTVTGIAFANRLVGFMLHNTAAPLGRIFYTINGGFHWELLKNVPTNLGFNDLLVLGPDLAYVVGAVQGTTAVVIRSSGD